MEGLGIGLGITLLVIVLCYVLSGLRIALEYERLVIFRLGKYARTIGPGVVWLLPGVETSRKVDLRIITQDIPRQEVMT